MRFIFTDFHFEMGGTAVFEVEERRVHDLFADARQEVQDGERVTVMFFRRAEYELSDDEAANLREAVTASDFWDLEPAYMNEEIDDGSSQDFVAVVGGAQKLVHAYHQWPPPLRRIKAQVRAIQAAHRPERESAPEIGTSEAEQIRQAARELVPEPSAATP